MRRRVVVDPNGAPERLRRFERRDWPDGCHPECAYWRAVLAWLAEDPDRDIDVVDGPDEPWHEELI